MIHVNGGSKSCIGAIIADYSHISMLIILFVKSKIKEDAMSVLLWELANSK